MDERTDKINGKVGFGYNGDKGDTGNGGYNILFSPVYYLNGGELPSTAIPFLSDNSMYINFPYTNLFDMIKKGDFVIISGNGGTKLHTILEDENENLAVNDTPIYDIDLNEMPNWQYTATVYTDDSSQICIHHSFSIENVENAKIVGLVNSDEVVFKKFGETEFVESTGKTVSDTPTQIIIFLYYKVSPYKIIKSLLYETTY